MFHVELRRFPHVARAFNLTGEELHARIVLPWVRGIAVELQERRFAPDRSRVTIYEAPELAPEQRGLGRGWSAVTRQGRDVTAAVLRAACELVPRPAEFKARLLSAAPLPLSAAVALGRERHPTARASELLAVVEQAVWELLHERRAALVRGGAEVAPQQWQELLLRWETWSEERSPVLVRLTAAPDGDRGGH